MKKEILVSLKFLVVMTILTGVLYPVVITGIAGVLFHKKAGGSLVVSDGRIIGSELIGQKFDSLKYFRTRPSAIDYNPLPSGGSNLGPMNEILFRNVFLQDSLFRKVNSLSTEIHLPPEMITCSGSGLDPEISPEAAIMQVERVATARRFTSGQKAELYDLVKRHTVHPLLYVIGEPRINVFLLNLSLEKIK